MVDKNTIDRISRLIAETPESGKFEVSAWWENGRPETRRVYPECHGAT